MAEKPPAPDPNKPQPPDWPFPNRQWPAYIIWANGGTTAQAAKAAHKARSSIQRWSREWRNTYNVDHLALRGPGFTPEAIAKGVDASALARTRQWREERAELAADAATEFEQTTALLAALQDGPLNPDNLQRHGLDLSDASEIAIRLTRMREVAARTFDRLSGIPELSRVVADMSVETDVTGIAPEGVLDELYGSNQSDPELLDEYEKQADEWGGDFATFDNEQNDIGT